MRRLRVYIISFYFWTELMVTSALLFPLAFLIWLVTVPFDRRMYLLHQFSCLWSNLVFFLNPLWKMKVYGKEKIDPKGTYVIVSNHQSGADILVLLTLRLHFKWVSKRSLFFFPFIGWNMAMTRYIALRRGKKSSMYRMMEKSRKALCDGNSMMIFPEGTRSNDEQIQPFKTGAFHLALDTRLPIMPIAIKGTAKAIRKGGFLISRNHEIEVSILDPVLFESFKNMDAKKLAKEIQSKVAAEIELA